MDLMQAEILWLWGTLSTIRKLLFPDWKTWPFSRKRSGIFQNWFFFSTRTLFYIRVAFNIKGKWHCTLSFAIQPKLYPWVYATCASLCLNSVKFPGSSSEATWLLVSWCLGVWLGRKQWLWVQRETVNIIKTPQQFSGFKEAGHI